MKELKNNLFISPTKKTVIILILVWLITIGLSVLTMTDLFREPFFSKENLGQYPSLLVSTFFVFIICFNYFNSKSMRFMDSMTFLLIVGVVSCASMVLKSSIGLYNNIGTIGTSRQWKFYASLISTLGWLFLFTIIVYKGVKKDLFRLKKI
ncbi:hypothetical protein [Wenyingzhuangia sp. IMCC45467]